MAGAKEVRTKIASIKSTQKITKAMQMVAASKMRRAQDRALGGSNLYHDAVTLQVFHVLTEVTGNPRYRNAAREYQSAFRDLAQSKETGLLAWGEHLYYDFFRDEVAAERRHHELLEWTPPWPLLWEVNPGAVERAIAGIRYHYFADDPAALYNRHADWARAGHQKPGGQPWIKHSGLYAYSFLFLHSKTKQRRWLDWALGAGDLYWRHRNPETGLTLSCIGDPRPGSRSASAATACSWRTCPASSTAAATTATGPWSSSATAVGR